MTPTTLILALAAGLAAGAVHVLTGPDHLAAVVPLAARARQQGERRGLAIGTLWGMGHGLGVVVLGGLGALVRHLVSFDLEAASGLAEVVVGFALVGLGVWTFRRSGAVVVHAHGHEHDDERGGAHGPDDQAAHHVHVHVHVGDETVGTSRHERDGKHGRHHHGAFAFGLLHGLAGTSHLVAALPALALGGWEAAAYIGGYLVAAIPLMALVSGAVVRMMATPGRIAPAMRASGALAATIGVVWIGVAFGIV